jgi:hypothetical protein
MSQITAENISFNPNNCVNCMAMKRMPGVDDLGNKRATCMNDVITNGGRGWIVDEYNGLPKKWVNARECELSDLEYDEPLTWSGK